MYTATSWIARWLVRILIISLTQQASLDTAYSQHPRLLQHYNHIVYPPSTNENFWKQRILHFLPHEIKLNTIGRERATISCYIAGVRDAICVKEFYYLWLVIVNDLRAFVFMVRQIFYFCHPRINESWLPVCRLKTIFLKKSKSK